MYSSEKGYDTTKNVTAAFFPVEYSKTCVKRPDKNKTSLAFQTGGCLLLHESSAESSCTSFLHYFHSAISNHPSIAISMSPKWMVP